MARDDDDKISDEPRNHSEDRDADPSREQASPQEGNDLGIQHQPMPMRLVGAIAASIFWGGLLLHGSCVSSAQAAMAAINIHNARIGGEGLAGTLAATQLFVSLLAAALLVGGVLLFLRKGFAKYMVMGVPAGIVLVEMATSVLCLIITSGIFLAQHNFDFLIICVFSLAIGGLNTYLLLDKEVAKALK